MTMSMTGYGRAEVSAAEFDIVVELRSVNHKFFEFSVRLPRSFSFAEDKLKKLCQARIARGKVDMFVTVTGHDVGDAAVEINHSLAKGYVDAIKEIGTTYGLTADVSAAAIARFPDVLSVTRKSIDEDYAWSVLSGVADKAVDAFLEMRRREGERLEADVMGRMNTILDAVSFIESKSPETVAAYRERLDRKMRELLGDAKVDEQRLITEAAIFADRIAVDEETVRLRSHFKQMQEIFASSGPIGRPLDFLVQEMNREINTIGSKSQNVEIAHKVVAVKSEIEKIREQIQNIE